MQAKGEILNTGSGESIFTFDELFYSKTDKKGIILAGNSVFQRVSQFSWDELIGSPHNKVRHPDMPRGVFYLLWKNLLAGTPVGAFVKNKSKHGLYYWVYAIALPVADGFISVRLKPGGSLLPIVMQEYINLRTLELKEKLSPEKSHDLLLGRLKELGFPTYLNFMSKALFDQIENRCDHLKTQLPQTIKIMRELHASCSEVVNRSREILQAYRQSMYIPLNLEISSAHLVAEGAQISVVANQYQKMATDTRNEMLNFETMAKKVNDQVEICQFYVGANQLMKDVEKLLSTDKNNNDQVDLGNKDITTLSKQYMDLCIEGMKSIKDIVVQFGKSCSDLQTIGSGLELVRITGKIETAKLNKANEISALLEDLKKFQASLTRGLRHLSEVNISMGHQSDELTEQLIGQGASDR